MKRLPRSWTLLYSLDQHGISLNTLYTRCESHAGGALVVMRDSNDAVFGAWMGEGIHMSKGAYYGSGESCVILYSCALFLLPPDYAQLGSYGNCCRTINSGSISGRDGMTMWRCANRNTSHLAEGTSSSIVDPDCQVETNFLYSSVKVIMACTSTKRSQTARLHDVQRSITSHCVRQARDKVKASRSSVSDWRYGGLVARWHRNISWSTLRH